MAQRWTLLAELLHEHFAAIPPGFVDTVNDYLDMCNVPSLMG